MLAPRHPAHLEGVGCLLDCGVLLRELEHQHRHVEGSLGRWVGHVVLGVRDLTRIQAPVLNDVTTLYRY